MTNLEKLQREYIKLLEAVCKRDATFLYLHGQKVDPDDVVYGEKLRKMIAEETK